MDNRFKPEKIGELALFHIGNSCFCRDRHDAAVLEANNSNEQPDADCNRMLEAVRHGGNQHLANARNREDQEDNAGDEHGCQADFR